LCDSQESAVGPLDGAATWALVEQATTRLGKVPGASVTALEETAVTAWHARNPALHGLPLFATAAAVHAVLDRAPTFELGGEEIIAALVRRERMRLEQASRNGGWGDDAASRLQGLAAVRDGLDAAAARRLTERGLETGLPPPETVIDAIRSLGWWKGDRVPAPTPDIVAAELLYQVLRERADQSPKWLAAVLDEASLDIERLGRLAHDMATLHGSAITELADRLIQAVVLDQTSAAKWRAVLNPAYVPFRLAAVGAAIGRVLLGQSNLDTDRAAILNDLSNRLSEFGGRCWRAGDDLRGGRHLPTTGGSRPGAVRAQPGIVPQQSIQSARRRRELRRRSRGDPRGGGHPPPAGGGKPGALRA
jgi:hypothetical protein